MTLDVLWAEKFIEKSPEVFGHLMDLVVKADIEGIPSTRTTYDHG